MLGLVVYLSTIFTFSSVLNVVVLPMVVFLALAGGRTCLALRPLQTIGLVLVVLSACISAAAYLLVGPSVESVQFNHPYLLVVLAAILVSLFLDDRDLRVVFLLVLVEVLVGIMEYSAGTHSFFVEWRAETDFGTSDLLYYNRVFGLSQNSSVFAFKILVAWLYLLAFYRRFPRWIAVIAAILLIVGFSISFNRTAIGAGLIAALIVFRHNIWSIIGLVIGAALAVGLGWQAILNQLSRGRYQAGGDHSGRDVIFSEFIRFVAEYPLLGNSGVKLWLEIEGHLSHAHNSFLETVASNGIPVSLLFLTGYFLLVWRAWRVVLPVLAYSLLQYGLFWGLAFHDIVLTAIFLQASLLAAVGCDVRANVAIGRECRDSHA